MMPLATIPKLGAYALTAVNYATERIYPVIYPFFISGTGVYHLGFGVNKISQTIANPAVQKTAEKTTQTVAQKFQPSDYTLKMHGLFLTASGCCNLLEALNRFDVIKLGTMSDFICKVGSVGFLYANIIALEENIRVYHETKNHEDDPAIHKHRRAAFWGILSNIGYILATAIILLGAPTALALVIGLISSLFGSLKILYDFMISHPEVLDCTVVS